MKVYTSIPSGWFYIKSSAVAHRDKIVKNVLLSKYF